MAGWLAAAAAAVSCYEYLEETSCSKIKRTFRILLFRLRRLFLGGSLFEGLNLKNRVEQNND
jgi:hypothetical protein